MTKIFSLAPNFSWVLGMVGEQKPFQRFVRCGEAVETAEASRRRHTRLKPGANEKKPLWLRAARKAQIAYRK